MQEQDVSSDPFAYDEEEKELEAISQELQQAQASIEGDVAKDIANKITPELEELFFEDKEAFLLEIFKLQNTYLEEHINPKVTRAKELEGSIGHKQAMQGISIAQQKFAQNHPEADINAMMEFFLTLPEQEQDRMGRLDPNVFFEELYKLFENAKSQVKPQHQLPTQLQGVGNNSAMSESASDLPMERI